MKRSAGNIHMTSFEELFQTGETARGEKGDIREIALDELFPFKEHPFKVLDDASMQDMAESVRANGVLVPGIARPRKEGGYELIAGHRRRRASELAGRPTMPVSVRVLDDDEAVIFMADSNLQRENLLPSEKAWAYKMKLDAIRRKAGRPAMDNPRQVGENYSVNILSENSSDSARNIHRYIRLTYLLPVLLQMVDKKRLPFNTAVELSYLPGKEQEMLLGLMGRLSVVPSMGQAGKLKKYSQEGKLDGEAMEGVLERNQVPLPQVTLKKNRLRQYFPENYTIGQMEEVIFSLLELWKMKNT